MTGFDEKAATWDQNPEKAQRAERVAERIRARCPLSAGISALEYGCGTGLLSFALRRDVGKITMADSSPGMREVLRRRIRDSDARNMSALAIDLVRDPAPPDRYDLVYTLMTLHHIRDPAPLLAGFFELLNPGGHLCIADLDREDGSFHGKDFDGWKGFDRDRLAADLESIGFSKVVSEICFTLERVREGRKRKYDIFLMTAKKPTMD
ncbi:MAG: class I SAM-dependent methyltransferase [Pirellulales bacterium]|nr:class I SAM-dependent methyltransferase [Pirellulales bacterium]